MKASLIALFAAVVLACVASAAAETDFRALAQTYIDNNDGKCRLTFFSNLSVRHIQENLLVGAWPQRRLLFPSTVKIL